MSVAMDGKALVAVCSPESLSYDKSLQEGRPLACFFCLPIRLFGAASVGP